MASVADTESSRPDINHRSNHKEKIKARENKAYKEKKESILFIIIIIIISHKFATW